MQTERLAELIDVKLQILRLLVRLAQQQIEVIAAGDMSQLLKLLSAKQTVMDQLQKVERGLDPFREDDPDTRSWESDAARRRCQQNVDLCNELLSEIMRLEKQGEADMVRRRDDAQERISGVHAASEARQAYFPSGSRSSAGKEFSSEG